MSRAAPRRRRPLGGFVLWLRFGGGTEGEVNLGPELERPVFGPLRDPARFAEARLDPELRTMAWPNGADLAAEFLGAPAAACQRLT